MKLALIVVACVFAWAIGTDPTGRLAFLNNEVVQWVLIAAVVAAVGFKQQIKDAVADRFDRITQRRGRAVNQESIHAEPGSADGLQSLSSLLGED